MMLNKGKKKLGVNEITIKVLFTINVVIMDI